jgi:hypothetical protein
MPAATKERTMPARAPGQHPAEGETVQEHDLEDRRKRRDQLASETVSPDTETQRETWADWMPNVAANITVSESEILERLNQSGKQSVTSKNLRAWEAQGIIPPPIPTEDGSQYPPGAAMVIHEAILAPHAQDWDANRARAVARQMAAAHDTTFVTSPPRETWWDWFPDASLDDAFTTEQLLESDRARISDIVHDRKRLRREEGLS